MRCDTIKVKPWADDQGEFVEVNKDEFDEKIHSIYVEGEHKEAKKASKNK